MVINCDSSAAPDPHESIIPVQHIVGQYDLSGRRFQVRLAEEKHVGLVTA